MIKKKTKVSLLSAIGLSILMGLSTVGPSYAEYQPRRVSGPERYRTSMESADYMESEILVFASGNEFADALSSVNICNRFDAKLVLVRGSEDMSSYVSNGGFKKVYIIGGQNSIPESFVSRLEPTGVEVKRLYGSDRYLTNISTLKEAGYDHVGVANGRMYPDALSASRFIKEKEIGLALVEADDTKISSDIEASVDYVFGGENSVSINEGIRISGKDRYDTSAKIAQMTDAANMVLVSGDNFADALSSVNIANAREADVVLAPRHKDPRIMDMASYADEIFVVGGQGAVSDERVKLALEGVEPEDPARDIASLGKYTIVNEGGKNFIKNNSTSEYLKYNSKTEGMVKIGNKKYVLAGDGSIRNGWISMFGKKYYSTMPNGLVRGWNYIDGANRYFSPESYEMYRNGVFTTGPHCYWFADNGAVRTGAKRTGRPAKYVRWSAPTNNEIKIDNEWINRSDSAQRFKSQKVANFAAKYDYLPYRWIGTNLKNGQGVYCCGLPYAAYKEFGVLIPGPEIIRNLNSERGYIMVRLQYQMANQYGFKYVPRNWNNLFGGDLLYCSSGSNIYNHAMIYLGRNGGRPMIIHSAGPNGLAIETTGVIGAWGCRFLPNALRYNQ